MVQRPEIREELYNAAMSRIETRSAMLSLLPGANLFAGVNYDSNSFLMNQSWADAGLQVTWNLLRVLTLPAIQAEGDARETLSDTRRLALRMAILTQVNVSYRRYQRATRQYARASELRDVEHRIAQATRSAEESDAQTPARTRSCSSGTRCWQSGRATVPSPRCTTPLGPSMLQQASIPCRM